METLFGEALLGPPGNNCFHRRPRVSSRESTPTRRTPTDRVADWPMATPTTDRRQRARIERDRTQRTNGNRAVGGFRNDRSSSFPMNCYQHYP
ncbi:hypothetical protein BRD01_08260 [Halobacteriales archaeon QS_8_65_32]|nr:MAG: hypothetical protein BRD01_08260 [Halobacteriales archaeon QS_8_65_32]